MCAYLTPSSEITSGQMWLWGVVSVILIILDYILPGYFSKVFGGTKAGITGATIGVFAGMIFLGPIGIVAGPFLGAVIGELLNKQQTLDKAIVVGFGSLLSFIVGTGIKLLAASGMLIYVCRDIFFN